MLAAVTLINTWFSSLRLMPMSEPLWSAVWGICLIAAAMLIRSVGERSGARE